MQVISKQIDNSEALPRNFYLAYDKVNPRQRNRTLKQMSFNVAWFALTNNKEASRNYKQCNSIWATNFIENKVPINYHSWASYIVAHGIENYTTESKCLDFNYKNIGIHDLSVVHFSKPLGELTILENIELLARIKQPVVYNTRENPTRVFHINNYSNITLREYGYLILNDSIRVMDNSITFQLMDSILSKSKSTRDYYYPIFQHIADVSDGALSEVIGAYSMKYIENNTDEFYERYNCCDSNNKCCEQLIKIAKFIQYEIRMQQDVESAYKNFIRQVETEKRKYPDDQLTILLVDNITNGLKDYTK